MGGDSPARKRTRSRWAVLGASLVLQAVALHLWYLHSWGGLQAPCPPPPLPTAAWRTLTDFLQHCDTLPEPLSTQGRPRKQLEQPAHQPTTLLEALGAEPAPPNAPRDPQSLVPLLFNVTAVVQACRHNGTCPTEARACVSDACPSYRPCPKKDKPRIGEDIPRGEF